MSDLTDLLTLSANEFWQAVGGYLPNIVGALLLILLGALVAKIADSLVRKLVGLLNISKLQNAKAVKKTLESTDLQFDVANIIGRITFWVIIIVFALATAEVLGLDAMRDTIRDLLGYLPNVLAGIIVLTVTIAGARLVRDAVGAALQRMSVDFARPVASVSYYVIIVFGALMALDQLGFDTTILANNITIIVAGVVLALSLAFGLGGREVAGRIVEQTYQDATKLGKGKKSRK